MNKNIETLLPEDSKVNKRNNKNKIIIIIIIAILLVVGSFSIILKNINKKDKKDDSSNNIPSTNNNEKTEDKENDITNNDEINNLENTYTCIMDEGWIEFDTTDMAGRYLGSYRKTTEYTFSLENNLITTTLFTIKLEFENIYGYDYKGGEKEGFVATKDDKELIKTYTSKTVIPVSISDTDTKESYIKKLESLNYKCSNK